MMAVSKKQSCMWEDCGQTIKLDPTNTTLTIFTRQPWFSFAMVTCPNCQNVNVLSFGPDDWAEGSRSLRDLLLHHKAAGDSKWLYAEEFPDESWVERWKAQWEVKDAPEYKLNKRHEALLVSLSEVLAVIPDDLLWLELTDNHNHDLPNDWC